MKVVIVGGAAAGMGVAAQLRRNLPTAEIVVYQKEKYVSLGSCGLPYFLNDNFTDPKWLIAREIKEFEKNNIQIHPQSTVHDIDFKKRRIAFFDAQKKEQFTDYDHLVLGVGAQPIIPNIPGINTTNVFTLTRLEDGINLKKYLHQTKNAQKIAVIGSGFIGLEVCEVLGSLEKTVHLIEQDEQLAARTFDPEISALVEKELIKNHIQIHKKDAVVEIVQNKSQKATTIKLKSGAEIAIDAIILATGFKPATDFLKNSDLHLTEQGAIIVNAKGKTNLSNVWSCGDCATTPHRLTHQPTYTALATVPRKFSKIIANNIAGKHQIYAGTLQTAIVRVFDLEIAETGLTEKTAQRLGYDYTTVLIQDKDHTNYVTGQEDLILKLVSDNKKKTLIGAQIVGYNKAVLRIHSLIAMIWNQTKLDKDLEQIDLPYAPPFARPVDIIHIALSKLVKNLK